MLLRDRESQHPRGLLQREREAGDDGALIGFELRGGNFFIPDSANLVEKLRQGTCGDFRAQTAAGAPGSRITRRTEVAIDPVGISLLLAQIEK